MDLYCQRCGEAYDFDYIVHEVTPEEAGRFKRGEGCPSCYGKPVAKRPFRAQVASAMRDIMGDDLDGIASSMEDAEAMMGRQFWE